MLPWGNALRACRRIPHRGRDESEGSLVTVQTTAATEERERAQRLSEPRRSREGRSSFSLPAPPSDEEEYWYFGRQHRWLLWVQASSFVLIAVSVLRFSTSDARLLLFLVPMSLFTITLVVSLLSSTRTR